MHTKKYPLPSARSRTHIRRNILSTLETQEASDDMWLNDVRPESPVAATQTQEHTVCYEDLPTMPLSVLSPSLVLQATKHEEELPDDDKTVQLNKKGKSARYTNSLDVLLGDETVSLRTALGSHSVCAETLLQTIYNGLNDRTTKVYDQSVQDCLTCFETLYVLANKEQFPRRTQLIRTQIAQSTDIVISLSLEHKITDIIEVQPIDEGSWKIQSLFYKRNILI